MMDTALQQQNDTNGQALVTPNERQTLIQKLHSKWPLELSTRIENQAYEKSHGIKNNYIKFVQMYFQQVQLALQNRASQQQQLNNNVPFPNAQSNVAQPSTVPVVNQVQQSVNPMQSQPPWFPSGPQTSRMANPQTNISSQMPRLREPQKFNPNPLNPLPYSQPSNSTTTTIVDLPQGYSSQQINSANQNDYSSVQPRYPIQPPMNIPRQRTPITNNNFLPTSSTNSINDIVNHFPPGNSSSTTTATSVPTPVVNPTNSSTGDQLLQRILLSTVDGGSKQVPIQNRQQSPVVTSQSTRPANPLNSNLNNSTNSVRLSLPSQQSSPSPSVVIIPPPTQTSTVQIQPSNNITIQQSPLSNNNNSGPNSVNSQTISTNSATPILTNYLSPSNRVLPLAGTGSILSPDNDTLNLIKYLKENVNRLQILTQKFTNEGNTDKVRQVQSIHQQIIQFINNPTYEALTNAKHFRDMLEKISSRVQPINPTIPSNVFNQCLKATNDFLLRDQKERINVTKRYLEPLTDVINGVPHKMMRLDVDNSPTVKLRSLTHSSLSSKITDELNQLPTNIYSIERVSQSRTRKISDDSEEHSNKNGLFLRCKLFDKSNPIIPPLRLYIPTSYPEQPPEILSLTQTTPPRLEFTDGHPFFDQISSVFISHLFKLRPQHTITDILNIWRQSVETAL